MAGLCSVVSGSQVGRTESLGLQQLERENLLPRWLLPSHTWHFDGGPQRYASARTGPQEGLLVASPARWPQGIESSYIGSSK